MNIHEGAWLYNMNWAWSGSGNTVVSPRGRVLKFCFVATQNYALMGSGHTNLRFEVELRNSEGAWPRKPAIHSSSKLHPGRGYQRDINQHLERLQGLNWAYTRKDLFDHAVRGNFT